MRRNAPRAGRHSRRWFEERLFPTVQEGAPCSNRQRQEVLKATSCSVDKLQLAARHQSNKSVSVEQGL